MASGYDDGQPGLQFVGELPPGVAELEHRIRAEEEQDSLQHAYEKAFETPSGRIVLVDLMREAGLFESSFTGEPQTTAFKEGRRSLLLYVLQQAGAKNMEAQEQMMRERALGLRERERA